jgi:hypothetical protein
MSPAKLQANPISHTQRKRFQTFHAPPLIWLKSEYLHHRLAGLESGLVRLLLS